MYFNEEDFKKANANFQQYITLYFTWDCDVQSIRRPFFSHIRLFIPTFFSELLEYF